ncbi:MAG: hypothetical protein AAGE94_14395 [Acidobacteriota bacterium]
MHNARSSFGRPSAVLLALLLVLGSVAAVAQTVTPGSFSFETIEAPGALATEASDIDKRGTVVGYTVDASGGTTGFLYDGAFTPFSIAGYEGTTIIGTNDKGALVGDVADASGTLHGYLSVDGEVTIYTAAGSDLTIALDVNKKNQVVGFYRTPANQRFAFLAEDDAFSSFSAPGAGPLGTRASGINKRGEISGVFFDADGTARGFVRRKNGTFKTIDFPGSAGTFLGRISNKGRVVVGSYLDANFQFRGFVRDGDGDFVTFDPPGAAGTFAVGLARDGRIVGSYDDANQPGRTVGFIATPLAAYDYLDDMNASPSDDDDDSDSDDSDSDDDDSDD